MCEFQCPGLAQGSVCSGHGRCEDGAFGSGLCDCDANYGGAMCVNLCPGGADNMCHGHGQCTPEIGMCYCDWYAPGLSVRANVLVEERAGRRVREGKATGCSGNCL